LGLLLDTQILVWVGTGSSRLKSHIRDALSDADSKIYISSVTAWEFEDLNARGRFLADLPFADIVRALAAQLLDFPAECWRLAATLPRHHRDPVDRMLIAHAMHADLTLVSADQTVRDYPVRSLW
jgi:PIN domain nuclease of toxin-antitoxin system